MLLEKVVEAYNLNTEGIKSVLIQYFHILYAYLKVNSLSEKGLKVIKTRNNISLFSQSKPDLSVLGEFGFKTISLSKDTQVTIDIQWLKEIRSSGIGFSKLAKIFIRDLEVIKLDPKGQHSVDQRIFDKSIPQANRDDYYKNVFVNRLSSDITNLCGQEIVVKQGGLDQSNPEDSFILWVKAYNKAKIVLTEQEQEVLKIVRPLAIIKTGSRKQPYLIMPKLNGSLALDVKTLPNKLLEVFQINQEELGIFKKTMADKGQYIFTTKDLTFAFLANKLRKRGLELGRDVWAKNAMVGDSEVVTIFDLAPKQSLYSY